MRRDSYTQNALPITWDRVKRHGGNKRMVAYILPRGGDTLSPLGLDSLLGYSDDPATRRILTSLRDRLPASRVSETALADAEKLIQNGTLVLRYSPLVSNQEMI